MSTLSLTCECLLLDASTVISLYSSRRMSDILRSLPVRAVVVDMTRQQEMKYIWAGPENDVRQKKEAIELQPLIDNNLIMEVELDDIEANTMVNIAALFLGNGESAATAVALHRGWAVCTDDYTALPRLQQFAPSVPFIVTSQLIQHWATATDVTETELQAVIRSMHLRARFGRSTNDVLTTWIRQYLQE